MSRPVDLDDGAIARPILGADRPRSHAGLAELTTPKHERHDDAGVVLFSPARDCPTQCADGLGQPPAPAFEHGTTPNKQNSSMLRRRASASVEIEPRLSEIPRAEGESESCPRFKAQQDAVQRREPHRSVVRDGNLIQEATPPTHGSRTALSDTLQARFRQLDTLRQERAKHIRIMQELQADVTRGRLAYGRLTQELLKVGRARDLKKNHIVEDEESLLREQQSMHHAEEEISAVLADISKLVFNTN